MKHLIFAGLLLLSLGCTTKPQHALNTQGVFELQAYDHSPSQLEEDLLAMFDASFCWFPEESSYFERNQWVLAEQSREAWVRFGKDLVAPYLAEHPKVSIVLTGYADATGSSTPEGKKANYEIALMRSKCIADLLVKGGVPRDSILLKTVGSDQANPKATPEEAAQERLVVIALARQ